MGLFHDLANSGLTAQQIAAAAEAIGQFPIRTSGGLTSETDGRGGTTISDNPAYRLVPDVRIGMVANAGPDGERDYTDERYWVLSLVTTEGGGNKPTKWAQDGSLADRFVTATHAFEAKDGTHTLAAGDMVLLLHFATVDHEQDVYVCLGLPKPSTALFGKLKYPGWSPGANSIDLQPVVSATDGTTLKKADGVTDQDPVAGVYIVLPTTSVVPCFQPQTGDILEYRKAGDIYVLSSPALFPVPQVQYEVILNMGTTPVAPHWVNSFPLIHN